MRVQVGDRVSIPILEDDHIWTVHEILPAGQVTCRRVPGPDEKCWGNYENPHDTMGAREIDEIFVQVASRAHLIRLF